jgi:hypothetical protein
MPRVMIAAGDLGKSERGPLHGKYSKRPYVPFWNDTATSGRRVRQDTANWRLRIISTVEVEGGAVNTGQAYRRAYSRDGFSLGK